MKNVIKENILIILAVSGFIFLITVYFIGLDDEGGIFVTMGSGIGTVTQDSYLVEVATELEQGPAVDIKPIKYCGGTRSVGDIVSLKDLFEVEYEDGTIVPLKEADNIEISLKDIRDSENNLVVTKLSTADIEALEEIPAAFIYDKEQSILYFHKSGVFTVYIRIYSGIENGVLYQFSIPVEVG